MVRGCQYQIGHKNHICSRLNHLHCLMGVLTIIGLVPQGCEEGGGHRSPEAAERTAAIGCCDCNVFALKPWSDTLR